MKHFYLSLVFFIVGLTLGAQSYLPEYYTRSSDTSLKMELRLNYQLSYQTSSIPNYFASYFLNGGTISNDTKNAVEAGLKNTNRAGFEQTFAIRFVDYSTHPFKDTNLGYYLTVEHQDHMAATFSRDAYDLAFYGNAPYAGQTMQLAPLNFTQFRYQKVGVGFIDGRTGSYAGISLVKGQSFSQVNFSKANFTTDDSTGNIVFDYNTQAARSDTAKTKFSAFNGVGVAVDFCWNIALLRDSVLPDLNHLQLRLQNAGFITWNASSLYYSADSSVHYNGFAVNNILKPDESLFRGNLNDTVRVKYHHKKYFSLLPADVVLGNVVNPYKGYWLKPLVGVRYKLIEGYKVMPYLGALVRISKRTNVQATVSYGGFGGLRAGLKFQAIIGKRISLAIGSSGLDGLYSSNRFGKDGYFGMIIRL